jgi:hypothetical protein
VVEEVGRRKGDRDMGSGKGRDTDACVGAVESGRGTSCSMTI